MPQLQENKKKLILSNALMDSGIRGAVSKAGRIALSSGFIQPGDVVVFNYRKDHSSYYESVVAMIVQTKVSSGVRISRGTGRKLLTCFKIEDDPESKEVLRRLYSNKGKSSFYRTSRMFGTGKYRTYIMDSSHMSKIFEIKINKEDL